MRRWRAGSDRASARASGRAEGQHRHGRRTYDRRLVLLRRQHPGAGRRNGPPGSQGGSRLARQGDDARVRVRRNHPEPPLRTVSQSLGSRTGARRLERRLGRCGGGRSLRGGPRYGYGRLCPHSGGGERRQRSATDERPGFEPRRVFPISWTLDTVGPMARSVADVAVLLDVLAGYDPDDPHSINVAPHATRRRSSGNRGTRIGSRPPSSSSTWTPISRGWFGTQPNSSPGGCVLEEITLPGCEDAAKRQPASSGRGLRRPPRPPADRPESFGDDVRRRLDLAKSVTGAEYGESRQRGAYWCRTVERCLRARRPDPHAVDRDDGTSGRCRDDRDDTTTRRLTYGWTPRRPARASIPCGFSDHGLPVGLQLAAARFQETALIRAGAAYQRETDWHLLEPVLSSSKGEA